MHGVRIDKIDQIYRAKWIHKKIDDSSISTDWEDIILRFVLI